jgi:hypothetical protein
LILSIHLAEALLALHSRAALLVELGALHWVTKQLLRLHQLMEKGC